MIWLGRMFGVGIKKNKKKWRVHFTITKLEVIGRALEQGIVQNARQSVILLNAAYFGYWIV